MFSGSLSFREITNSGLEGLLRDEGEDLWQGLLQGLGRSAQVLQELLRRRVLAVNDVRHGLEREHGDGELVAHIRHGCACEQGVWGRGV